MLVLVSPGKTIDIQVNNIVSIVICEHFDCCAGIYYSIKITTRGHTDDKVIFFDFHTQKPDVIKAHARLTRIVKKERKERSIPQAIPMEDIQDIQDYPMQEYPKIWTATLATEEYKPLEMSRN